MVGSSNVEKARPAPTYQREAAHRAPEPRRTEDVKYMLLIYNNPAMYEAWSEPERAALFGEVDEIMNELATSGELVRGEALADPSNTRTVRVRDGVPVVTDGPLAEAKEQFAGYLVVDCETADRAVEIAARWPDAKHFAMEVRPIMHTSGSEM
jgi:hypothetical protein